MDVFISRWLEKTFDFTQIVACNIAGFMLFTSFGEQNQKWKTFIVSISRIFANTAITFCQRNRPKVKQNLHLKLGQEAPSFGSILAYLETTA